MNVHNSRNKKNATLSHLKLSVLPRTQNIHWVQGFNAKNLHYISWGYERNEKQPDNTVTDEREPMQCRPLDKTSGIVGLYNNESYDYDMLLISIRRNKLYWNLCDHASEINHEPGIQ